MTDDAPAAPHHLPRWKVVAFSLVILTVFAAVLEIASNVYLRSARGYAGGEFLQYEFDPYKNIGLQRNWTDTRGVHHNAQGFRRTTDVAREKPEGTIRIFLMGASTAYGLGGMWPHLQEEFEVLDNSETIDAYLEQLLKQAWGTDRVEVINAAVPSIWTHHHLINLNQTILRYDPDMVLFLDGWNDHFFYSRSHDQFASYAYDEASNVIMGPPTVGALLRMNSWWLFRKSAFFHVVGRAAREVAPLLRGRTPPRPIDVEKAVEDVQWVFERNALQMIERNALILQAARIPAIFMLQPILAIERDRIGRMPEIERRLFEFNLEAWAPGYEEFMRGAVPPISRRIAETVTPLGAGYLDMTGIYATSKGQIFTDYAHLTPEGNRILAERLLPEIMSRISPPR
jgi:hypothetical protein